MTERNMIYMKMMAFVPTFDLTKVTDFKPQPFTILGWQVPDIRQAVSDL